METIKIFLAGAKNLQEERTRLKALANALSFKYGREGKAVSINMSSYEDFGDRQSTYDSFIQNEADMVIFLFGPRIGEKTEAEIRLAYDTLRLKRRPEVHAFVQKFETRTPDIDYLEKVLNTVTDNYYVDFDNVDDLLSKAKERICAYVDNRLALSFIAEASRPTGNTATQTPMFRIFAGVAVMYYILGGLAWMILYSTLGVRLGWQLGYYLAGILVLTIAWIVIASIVGSHDAGYQAKQTQLIDSTDDVRAYVAELRQLSETYGKPETARQWKQLIQEAESIPPRQFHSQRVRLEAKAQQLKYAQ